MELDHGKTERRRIIASGVVVEVEGDSEVLRDFTDALIEDGLLRSVRREFASLGFGVLTHRSVPPNDGGISFGQAAIAARRVD